MKKTKLALAAVALLAMPLCSCDASDFVNHNLKVDANNFKVRRKATIINLRSDKVLMDVEGLISISDSSENELAITIKTSPDTYKMHYVYTGSEVVYLIEQLDDVYENMYAWKINLYWQYPEITFGY